MPCSRITKISFRQAVFHTSLFLLCMLFGSSLQVLGFTRSVLLTFSSSIHSCRRICFAFSRPTTRYNVSRQRFLSMETSETRQQYQNINGLEAKPPSKPMVVVLAGPTAVGKSDVAAQICAAHDDGLIVSADSVQAYRGVQIGANKPTQAERDATPHLLIDVADAEKAYNAAEWTQDAMYCIQQLTLSKPPLPTSGNDSTLPTILTAKDEETRERWRQLDKELARIRSVKGRTNADMDKPLLPVVVGGTMMYVQWLVHGRPDAMRPTPTAVSRAVDEMQAFQEKQDWEGAVARVSKLGPKFVQQIEKLSGRDWYRLRRILEVAYTVEEMGDNNSTDTLSLLDSLYSGERAEPLESLGYDVRCFFLCPTDRMVHSKIVDERCEQMIVRGLMEETVDLFSTGQLPDMAQKAIGYRQTLDYLESPTPIDSDRQNAFVRYLEEFSTATRRYSKRQMQWFRRDKDFVFVPICFTDNDDDDGGFNTNTKNARNTQAAAQIRDLLRLSRSDFDKARTDPNGINKLTRQINEAQGKTMKTYQFRRQILVDNSPALSDALERAEACRHRFQSKRRSEGVNTVSDEPER